VKHQPRCFFQLTVQSELVDSFSAANPGARAYFFFPFFFLLFGILLKPR
jgi:hypothetical protein